MDVTKTSIKKKTLTEGSKNQNEPRPRLLQPRGNKTQKFAFTNYYNVSEVFIFGILKKNSSHGVPLTFSYAQLAKGKCLARSKPATKSQAQALATHCVEYSTISKSYRTAFYRNKLSTTRCD